MTADDDRLSRALGARYRLGRVIGQGGMATVYLAEDLKHHRLVAVKVLRPTVAAALGSARFLREIAISAQLSHPHILPLHDSGEANGFLFYVMPYVEGESLRERLTRETQLATDEAIGIARDVADALAHAHARGVIHRDIKPENILLQGTHAIVADFGIASAVTVAGGERVTSAGIALGTPAYMSPEQAGGDEELDGRSDLYSLGCVLYEMLAGDPPFTASTPQALLAKKLSAPLPRVSVVRAAVPPHVEAALSRALARVPADRFRTTAEFAVALAGPDRAAPARAVTPRPRPRTRRLVLGLVGAAAVLAAAVLLGRPALRRFFEGTPTPRYSDTPRRSAWRGWTGEYFPIVAVDESVLVVRRLGAGAAHVFDGRRWTTLVIPAPFDLLPYVGRIVNRRFLATTQTTGAGAQRLAQYWWLSLSAGALRPLRAIAGPLPDEGRPGWWSDGDNLAIWLYAVRRREADAWILESTGTVGRIGRMWGRDVSHRFAIATAADDSLLVFDGISWKPADLPRQRGPGRLTGLSGTTFGDGATVVVGQECVAEKRCRPLVLEQERFGAPWRRVAIPAGIGLATALPRDTAGSCDPGRFSLSGVAGRARSDYFVWGDWLTCERRPLLYQAAGCPPRQPCIWHVRSGNWSPVEDLLGKVVHTMVYVDTTGYALTDDGTLWRRVGSHWRPLTQVPGLPLRLVGASRQVIVRLVGGMIRYEPGIGDSLANYFSSPGIGVPPGVSEGRPPRQLVVRDSSAALLTADGAVFASRCGTARVVAEQPGVTPGGPGPGLALRCPEWARLSPAPRSVAAIDLLPDGRLIGVGGRGLAVTWRDGVIETESLPGAARADSLWGVAASADGEATAIGLRTVVRRDRRGTWTLVRRLRADGTATPRFAVLPDGDLVVARRAIHVWDRSADSLPVATLYQAVVGEAQLSVLHALADGRLVAGFADPDDPLLGGRLIVWAAPVRANHSAGVPLPLNLDITDLADDGKYLYVVGRGGALTIRLDSLPFAPASRRD